MQFEIEVKSLLSSREAADILLAKLKNNDPHLKPTDEQSQLNHYFKGESILPLINLLSNHYPKEKLVILNELARKATSFTVRSRQKNGKTFLVVKGSLDNTSADHSHRRMEFEEPIGIKIDDLDTLIIKAGFALEAKWSASRKMYAYKDMTVDMMFSPGYGYVVEFEKVINSENDIESTRKEILDEMLLLDITELDPGRLQRMFAYYNEHWQEYYGTKKVFSIE